MPFTGFHSEWITIANHRILLECRASFPDERLRFIARVAVEVCQARRAKDARVTKIFYDDKSCFTEIELASTARADDDLADRLQKALHTIYGDGNCQAHMRIVREGDRASDHYDHMEHLSVASGVAVSRWKKDREDGDTNEPPR